jgi:hypothetical protein
VRAGVIEDCTHGSTFFSDAGAQDVYVGRRGFLDYLRAASTSAGCTV